MYPSREIIVTFPGEKLIFRSIFDRDCFFRILLRKTYDTKKYIGCSNSTEDSNIFLQIKFFFFLLFDKFQRETKKKRKNIERLAMQNVTLFGDKFSPS